MSLAPINSNRSGGASLLSRRRRGGFTLVELLVTLMVLTIMASLMLFAVGSAQRAAREAKTRSMVVRLHTLLMERWDSYATRRVPLRIPPGMRMLPSPWDVGASDAATARLSALRLTMQMEMPDRWSEIFEFHNATSPNNPLIRYATYWSQLTAYKNGVPPLEPTALSRAYYRRYLQVANHPQLERYQGAECLYLIVTMATGDGTALEQFSDSEIGDIDGDGAPEFLDGWGQPISFIRWPAGFVSDIQTGDAEKDHDPYDLFRIHENAYRLVPLIYSGGADEEYGVAARPSSNTSWLPNIDVNPASDTYVGYVDPYAPFNPDDPPGEISLLGQVSPTSDQHLDNITNHLLGP
jgi:prepilin-type N-terminal cleavage/methylation domain-containing protein